MSFNTDPGKSDKNAKPLSHQLLWFFALYGLSILSVGGFVYGLRFILGMH